MELVVAEPIRLEVSSNEIDQWIGGDRFESATTFQLRPVRNLEGFRSRRRDPVRLAARVCLDYYAQIDLHSESGQVFRHLAWLRHDPYFELGARPLSHLRTRRL
jgi:hypothetical protein